MNTGGSRRKPSGTSTPRRGSRQASTRGKPPTQDQKPGTGDPGPRTRDPGTGTPARLPPAAREILEVLRRSKAPVLSSNGRLDGDALGSELALAMLLERLGVRARVVNDGPVPSSLRFLPGIERAATFPDGLAEPADLLVTVDCGARELLFGVAEKLRDVPIANVDHHVGNAGYGRWNWIEPRAAAVGEMIYDLVEACGVVPDAAMATNIYVSLVTDTGRFSFSNTTPRTHEIAARLLRAGVKPDLVSREVYRSRTPGQLALLARTIASLSVHAGGRVATARLTQAMCRECGAAPWDTQEFVDVPKSVRGAEVGLLLRELGDGSIKVSLRSEGGVDVDALARRFGGGGHVRASGCTLPPPLSEAERRVLAAAEQALDGAGKSLTSPPVIH